MNEEKKTNLVGRTFAVDYHGTTLTSQLAKAGENWLYFEDVKRPGSCMHAFTVTYLHGGMVVMTGDWGVLVWQKIYVGFPGKNEHIGYFAEKVVNAFDLMEWDSKRAAKEARIHFKERFEEEDEDLDPRTEKAKELFKAIERADDEKEMLNLLNDFKYEDWWDCAFGKDYDWNFRFKFELLKGASPIIQEYFKKGER